MQVLTLSIGATHRRPHIADSVNETAGSVAVDFPRAGQHVYQP
jgi:hypothetical protein